MDYSGPVRVAIASRQEVVGRGLTAMLSDYPDRVTVVALPARRHHARGVDVVLFDTIGLHGGDTSELEHFLHRTPVKVLIFSRDMRPDLRAKALALGAPTWVSMSTRALELVAAIEAVAAGRAIAESPDYLGDQLGLTRREVEIVALIAQGFTNSSIADHLIVSPNTLKSHVRNIYRKIGVERRSQAVVWAIEHGFAPPDSQSLADEEVTPKGDGEPPEEPTPGA